MTRIGWVCGAVMLSSCAGAPEQGKPPLPRPSATQPSAVASTAVPAPSVLPSASAAPTLPPDPPENHARTDELCSSDGWCWVGPQPRGGEVRQLWGTGPKNVYAIAGEHILHYDGERWAGQKAENHQLLNAIWGSGPEDVWAVGHNGAVLRYDGKAWEKVHGFGTHTLTGVWASAPNDVYVAAHDATLFHYDGVSVEKRNKLRTSKVRGVFGRSATAVYVLGIDIMRFDGVSWSVMPGSEGKWFEYMSLSSDGTLFGGGSTRGINRHDGKRWEQLPRPFPSPNSDQATAAWAASDDAVFAVGLNGRLGRFDGTAWQTWRDDPKFRNLACVWGTSEKDVFAGGRAGEILHFDGEDWSVQTRGVLMLSYIAAAGEDGAVSIFGAYGKGGTYDGKGGFLAHDVFGMQQPPYWSHYFGREAMHIGGKLYVVHAQGWLSSLGNVRNDDDTDDWDTVWEDAGSSARDVWGTAGDDLYVATDHGLLHFDGKQWTRDKRLGDRDLCEVRGNKSGDLFVRTCKHEVLERRGKGWRRVLTKPKHVQRMFLTESGEIFGTRQRKAANKHEAFELLQHRGGRWKKVWEDESRPVTGVWSPRPDEAWAVAKRTVLHFDGKQWSQQTIDGAPGSYGGSELTSVTGNDKFVFVVGYGGALLRKPR